MKMRPLVLLTAICCSTFLSQAGHAQPPTRQPTHIAAQPLGPALKELAASRGLQVLYFSAMVEGLQTHGVTGDLSTDEALDGLLIGTGLAYRFIDSKTVSVFQVNTQPRRTAPPVARTSAPYPGGDGVPQVTILAEREKQRAELQARITAFVGKIGGPIYDGGLARWGLPVCPLVSGLPEEEGEFILGRVSEIALASGIPLADEKCRPNLLIVVSSQPQDLMKRLDNRQNWVFAFGIDAAPPVIDEFISMPRTVRIIYRSLPFTVDGLPVRVPSHPMVIAATTGPAVMTTDTYWTSTGTRLGYTTVYKIFRVLMVIDQTRLHGVSRGQFADYVAMVGLAQLKPSARLDDAQTILKLFDGVSQTAPAGLTDWDQAFLKSLYTTDPGMTQQRNDIAHAMVDAISH
jgi:hypothetical protein